MGEKKIKEQEKKDDENFEHLSNIVSKHDVDQLIDFLKNYQKTNSGDVFEIGSGFIDQNSMGMELFFKTAIKLEPNNPSHHYNYALYLESQKSFNDAQNEFQTAIELDIDNEIFHADYGNLLFQMKDFDAAEKHFKDALRLNPENAHVWTNLGILYSKSEKTNQAENALKKAIDINPQFPLSYLNLMELYEGAGKVDEAKELWKDYQNINIEELEHENLKFSIKE